MSDITVTFNCRNCGGTSLELPDDYTDDSIAKCATCKTEFGRFGDVKERAIAEAKEKIGTEIKGAFRDAFKGLKGFTIK